MPKHLEKQEESRNWHAVVYIPKDVQPYFGGKTRFYKSLGTDSLSEAEIKKLPIVGEWKELIKAARKARGPVKVEDIAAQVRLLRDEIRRKWQGHEGDAMLELATNLRDHPDQGHADELFARVTGEWNPTADYIKEWLEHAEYQPKTADEARTNVQQFCDEFSIFEKVTRKDLEGWVEGLLKERSIPTVKKKVGHVRAYWAYCHKKEYTKATPLPEGLVPKPRKNKATATAAAKRKRGYWTAEDYQKLIVAKPEDTQLVDLIKLGAHTGCRLEEICAMPLANVKEDRFIVQDAKTEAGWREIPIHSDIKQTVARLVDESTDGFLLSGLSSENKYRKRGSAIGKRFGRLRTVLGYPDTLVFHSFRKTLLVLMRDVGIPEHQAALIVGHEPNTITYGLYGNDISFRSKVEIMESISYNPSSTD
jgi:integrase